MPLALLLPLIPSLIETAMRIYQTAAADPETPEEKRTHYASIAAALETANLLVQTAPLPPVGSGREETNG
jgi:hypothetical protein